MTKNNSQCDGAVLYRSIHQLNKRENGEERNPIFAMTPIQAVFDAETGASLESILLQFNSIYVQFQGTPKDTRLAVPMAMRRSGLVITYVDMDGNAVTEKALSATKKEKGYWEIDENWSNLCEPCSKNIGTTEERPVLDESKIGYQFYDSSIKKPIWWNGSSWTDASGVEV